MTQQSTQIDPAKTAVLIMDFQQRIIANVASDPVAVVENAAKALDGARAAGIPVIYVVHRGGPFADYAPDIELHPGVTPSDGEMVITKVRPGPFSTTALDVTLREMGRDTLVIMGVATSGCVLSGVRWAVDVNYSFIVLSDACSDGDPEVHRVLTEKVYPRQGRVMATDEFLQAI
jgi:nicotinamidase-related amidase